jgi:hypothetical protein
VAVAAESVQVVHRLRHLQVVQAAVEQVHLLALQSEQREHQDKVTQVVTELLPTQVAVVVVKAQAERMQPQQVQAELVEQVELVLILGHLG